MITLLMNNELEGVWKESSFRHFPGNTEENCGILRPGAVHISKTPDTACKWQSKLDIKQDLYIFPGEETIRRP
jgi:hypothetical protein